MRVLSVGRLVNFVAQKVLNTEINTLGTYLVFAYNECIPLNSSASPKFCEEWKTISRQLKSIPKKCSKFLYKSCNNCKTKLKNFLGAAIKKLEKFENFPHNFFDRKIDVFSAEKWVFYGFSTLFSIERFLPFVEIKPRNQSKYNMKLFSFEFLISLDFPKV